MYRFFLATVTLLAIVCCSCGSTSTSKNSDEDDYEIWGIDISKHQISVDWDHVAQSDNIPHFVFLKATEGTLIVDPTYEKHIKELRSHDILCGAYHFFGHRTSGREQAKQFIRTAKLKKGDLFPVLDIEYHRFFKDPKKLVREVKAFCDESRKYYGINPILYCSTHFYNKYLKSDFPENDYILWIADYRCCPDMGWHFWQMTDKSRLSGISGLIDKNVFSGSKEDLEKLILR